MLGLILFMLKLQSLCCKVYNFDYFINYVQIVRQEVIIVPLLITFFFSILKMRKFILVDLRGSSLTSQQYKLPRFSPCFIALSSVKTGMLMFFGEPLFFSAQPLNLSSVLHLDTLQTQFICKILILIEEERLEPNFYLLSSIVS